MMDSVITLDILNIGYLLCSIHIINYLLNFDDNELIDYQKVV